MIRAQHSTSCGCPNSRFGKTVCRRKSPRTRSRPSAARAPTFGSADGRARTADGSVGRRQLNHRDRCFGGVAPTPRVPREYVSGRGTLRGLDVESSASDHRPSAVQDQIRPGGVSGPHLLTPPEKRGGVLDGRVPGPREMSRDLEVARVPREYGGRVGHCRLAQTQPFGRKVRRGSHRGHSNAAYRHPGQEGSARWPRSAYPDRSVLSVQTSNKVRVRRQRGVFTPARSTPPTPPSSPARELSVRPECDLGANPRTVVAQHGTTAAQHPKCRGVLGGGLGHDTASSGMRGLGEQQPQGGHADPLASG